MFRRLVPRITLAIALALAASLSVAACDSSTSKEAVPVVKSAKAKAESKKKGPTIPVDFKKEASAEIDEENASKVADQLEKEIDEELEAMK